MPGFHPFDPITIRGIANHQDNRLALGRLADRPVQRHNELQQPIYAINRNHAAWSRGCCHHSPNTDRILAAKSRAAKGLVISAVPGSKRPWCTIALRA